MAFNEKYVTVSGGGLHDGSSEANAWTLAEAAVNVSAGDRVNVKAGTHTLTSVVAFTTGGSLTAPIAIRGYKTTIGDQDYTGLQRVEGTDIPLIVCNGSSSRWYVTGAYYHMENIAVKNNAVYDFPFQFSSDYGQMRRCKFESINERMSCRFSDDRIDVEDCYFKGNSGATSLYACNVYMQNGSVFFYGCVFDGGIYGARSVGEFTSFYDCVFVNQTTAAMNGTVYGGGSAIVGSTFYNMSNDAIQLEISTSSPGPIAIRNNVFSDVTGTAINDTNTASRIAIFPTGNLFYNCGTTINSDPCSLSRGNIVDSSSPLVDPANGDYSLVSTSGGFGKAQPNPFEGLDANSNRDIGAMNHVPVVDSSQPQEAGTQILPFSQWAVTRSESALHPLRSS